MNTRHNVLYIHGQIPGHGNSLIKIKDTFLPSKKLQKDAPPFPTYYPEEDEELDEDLYDEELFRFTDTSVIYEQDEEWWRLRGEPKVLCVDWTW